MLIAEDDPVSARALKKTLESSGHPVEHATTGIQAFQLFRSGNFRIVISDWMMPEMEGVSLCRAIRSEVRPYTYVILLTSRGDRRDRWEAFDAGVDDMLAKPLDRQELAHKLKVAARILAMEDRLQDQNAELEATGESLRQANVNLHIASRRFEGLFQNVPIACFTVDREGLVFDWNRHAEDLFGIASHEAYLRPIRKVLGVLGEAGWIDEAERAIRMGASVEGKEWNYRHPAGTWRHLICNLFPLSDSDGGVLGAIWANVDITDRKRSEQRIEDQVRKINRFAAHLESQKKKLERMNARLERLAITDGLTGLKNHRRFHEELREALESCRLSNRPLTLLMLDVDHFKAYNDTFGHPAGDRVLQQLARLIRSRFRGARIAGRYGGEEFAILLPNVDARRGIEIAERFRKAVAGQRWELKPVTVSIGVSTAARSSASADTLVAQADAAMYESKRAGRNRCTHWNSLPADAPGKIAA